MQENIESRDIEQLMADADELILQADELIQQIDSDFIKAMKEEHRTQFEKHAQNLRKIQSRIQGEIEKKGASRRDSGSEGMHEAILDIVKATQGLKKYLSDFR